MIDLAEQRFGRLFVLDRTGISKNGHILWLCLCDCGQTVIIKSSHLRNNHTKSCGCLYKDGNNISHGHNRKGKESKTHMAWRMMIQRCTNPNYKGYHNYGGRGITVCKRWMKFSNFLEDMGEDWKPGLMIERMNNNKGYFPENCCWVTRKQQARNKRNNHLETFNGKTQCIVSWAEEIKISAYIIYNRLDKGWSIKETLTIPVGNRRKIKC